MDGMLNLEIPEQEESTIKVFGVGGGGCNAVNYMCQQGIKGVEFVVCNTDIQVLRTSPVRHRIQIGKMLTDGRGAGSHPERGRDSAIESLDYIRAMLERNTEMLFITAGMGGGTGTGAAPVIAELAKSLGILTIAIVTIPFNFEGKKRVEQALDGIERLSKHVDSLLIICNEKLREMYGNLKLSKAFAKADDVLAIAARSIAEIITMKGLVNINLPNIQAVMRNSGVALMGAGDASGENREMKAVQAALHSPLLNSSDIRGASKILLNYLYGDQEPTYTEMGLVQAYLKDLVGHSVNINWGLGKDNTLKDALRVVVIATGFNQGSLDSTRHPKTPFNVEIVEDLKMESEDPRVLEERERERRRLQQERANRQPKPSPTPAYDDDEPRPPVKRKTGVNTIPDVTGWLRGRFGNMFVFDTERDHDI
ncbi:MAG: cell division protein FtsZ [Odoribacteraceae bacterium]|jgi:cell division protein FtsZ|nr:cell division protein FtsZ [Odoribacteraceae bacterium]